jgi:phospholipid/cholesterol/gamma-HCH transport system substrate-binding protein
METRAPYALIGGFLLAAIIGVFGFVYWIQNTGGLGERKTYEVQFENSVSGLLTGAAVLFNGIRVGEVSRIRLAPDRPKDIMVSISVDPNTPIRSDTQVGLEFQGLTGVPVVTLAGGAADAPALPAPPEGTAPLLVADPFADQSMTEAARTVLRRIDTILTDNSDGLKSIVANIDKFSAALGKNSGKVDQILDGLGNMFGATSKPVVRVFDIAAAKDLPAATGPGGPVIVDDPTTVSALDSQRIMKRGANDEFTAYTDAQWSDALPKLLQSRIIQSLENAGRLKVGRPLDNIEADHHLVMEVRSFQIVSDPKPEARVEISARLVGEGGALLEAQIFRAGVPLEADTPEGAANALNKAFGEAATGLVEWAAKTI